MTMTMAALKEERQAKYKVRQEGIGRQLDWDKDIGSSERKRKGRYIEKEAKVSIDSERQKDKYVDKRRATLCNVRAHREREIERTIDWEKDYAE